MISDVLLAFAEVVVAVAAAIYMVNAKVSESISDLPSITGILGGIEPIIYVYFWEPCTDKQGFTDVTGACGEFFCGLSREDIIRGKYLFQDFVHPDDLWFWRPTNEYCHQVGADFVFDMRMKTETGDFRWCRAKAKYVGRKEDLRHYWYGMVDDISDLKAVCTEIERCRSVLMALETILDSTVDFYFYVDEQLRVVTCSNMQGAVRTRYFLDDFVEDIEDKSKLLNCVVQRERFPVKMVEIRARLPGRLEEAFKAYTIRLPPPLDDRILVALQCANLRRKSSSSHRRRHGSTGTSELIFPDLEADTESVLGFLFSVTTDKDTLRNAWETRDISACLRCLENSLPATDLFSTMVRIRFLAFSLLSDAWTQDHKISACRAALADISRYSNRFADCVVMNTLFYLTFSALSGLADDALCEELFTLATHNLRSRCTLEAVLHLQMGIRVADAAGLQKAAWWFSMSAGLCDQSSLVAVQMAGVGLFNLAVCCDRNEGVVSRIRELIKKNPDVEFDSRISKLLCEF